jgi:CSLREA domain-containing protein
MTRLVSLAMMLAGIAIGALSPSPAAGVEFQVNTTEDLYDADPGDGVCADGEGRCTLRAAVEEASALPGPDRILLPPGVYTLQFPVVEDMGFAGDLDVRDDLSVEGAGADVTIVDGSLVEGIFQVFPEVESFALANLTLRNAGGPAVSSRARRSSITDAIVEGSAGSGIYFTGGIRGGELQIVRSEIRGNRGGGINAFSAVVSITDSLVSENGADLTSGAGGVRSDAGRLSIQRTRVLGNFRSGIVTDRSAAEITQSIVADNLGSGLSTASVGARVVASTFSGNDIGLAVTTFESLTVIDSTVSGNRVGIDQGLSTRAFLRGTTINGNEIGLGGLHGPAGTADRAVLSNVVLAGNGQDCQTSGAAVVTSEGYNLIGDSTGCTIVAAEGDQIGAPGSPIDPGLGPLADNGGPTPTHAPQPGSPLIDAGNPALPGSSEAACSVFDQRGVAHLQDGDGDDVARCDIGAVERPGATVPALDTSFSRYDFGKVEVGGESTHILTISNVGSATLTVSGVELLTALGAGFVRDPVAALPIAMEPGGHLDVRMRFLPVAEGQAAALLRIASDDPQRPEVHLPLGGAGVASDDETLALLTRIDTEVAEGDLTGTGDAPQERLVAFRDAVEAAEDLLEHGRLREACRQLETALRRVDGTSPPPDLVEGAARGTVHVAILTLRSDLGCDELPPPGCGLGPEIALALAAITSLRKRWAGRVPA